MAITISVLPESINYKSIDITTNDKYTESDSFVITPGYISSDFKVVFNKAKTKATLIISDNNKLLGIGKTYTISLIRDSATAAMASFTFSKPISMDNANDHRKSRLIARGTNLLTIQFPYPINIQDSTLSETSPFYILPESQQIGMPNIPINKQNGFTWTMSPDLKSVNIESKYLPFNIGNISIFVNFPTAEQNTFSVDADGKIIVTPISKAKFFKVPESIVPTLLVGTDALDGGTTGVLTDPTGTTPTGLLNPQDPAQYSNYHVPDVPDAVTAVESIKYLNANEIIVKFSEPVLLEAQGTVELGYNGIIYSTVSTIPGSPVLKISRPIYSDDNGDELIYSVTQVVAPGVPQPVIFSSAVTEVTLYPILDAFYNYTPSETASYTMKPNVVQATIVSGTPTPATKIQVFYDSTMNVNNTLTPLLSANSISNYTIQGYLGLITDAEEVVVDSKTTIVLTLDTPLPYGSYKVVVAKTVSDTDGTPLVNNEVTFLYKDNTNVTVNIIGYAAALPPAETFTPATNKVVIKYDEAMVTGNTVQYAANNPTNFRAVNVGTTPNSAYELLQTSEIVNLYPTNDIFRMTLTPSTPVTPFTVDNLRVDVGYIDYETDPILRYVKGLSGRFVSFGTKNINSWATAFDFCANGSMTLIADNKIKYTYNQASNNNEFYNVTLTKLQFTLVQDSVQTPLTAISYTLSNSNKEIIFTLSSNINITATTPEIVVTDTSLTHNEAIIDIFGNGVVINNCTLDLINGLPPVILSTSIVSVTPKTNGGVPVPGMNVVKTALFFNKGMQYTEADDFLQCVQATALELHVPTAANILPLHNHRIIELATDISNYYNAYNLQGNSKLQLITNVGTNGIRTADIDNNLLEPIFTPKTISNIGMSSFLWEINDGATALLANNKFTAKYDNALSPSWFYEYAEITTPTPVTNMVGEVHYYVNNVEIPVADYDDPITAGTIVTCVYNISINGHSVGSFLTVMEILLAVTPNEIGLATDVDFAFEDTNKSISFTLEFNKASIPDFNLLTSRFLAAEYAFAQENDGVYTFVDVSHFAVTAKPVINATI